MANASEVTAMLDLAAADGTLTNAVVLGIDKHGALKIYTPTADTDTLLDMLERARLKLED